MKLLFLTLFYSLALPILWLGDFNEAIKQSTESHKLILVNFSGSDWCGPCIRLRREILESDVFEKYASDHLILVRADFPRQKKNQLPAKQLKLNEALAERYNSEGKFPYTLLVDGHGKILKFWDGYPNETPEKFVKEIADLNKSK